MSVEIDRIKTRFDNLFANEGLTNIKFFVRPTKGMTNLDFLAELNTIQDTIAAQDFKRVEDIDQNAETRRFDEPFN
ncbi:hypothetical protein [Mesorhizobium amorphae]|uniref:hypothetical protein n=1 Tax=Mesorhizobium amorphae TaxID=71433 RepID=UPI001781A2DD|nr:hypothetical protein [Mesorhizobium amorphae]